MTSKALLNRSQRSVLIHKILDHRLFLFLVFFGWGLAYSNCFGQIKQAELLDPVNVPIVHDGKTVGQFLIRAGSVVHVIDKKGRRVLIKNSVGSVWIDESKLKNSNLEAQRESETPSSSFSKTNKKSDDLMSDEQSKQKLKDEYYEFISTDPERARKARDEYMALVNQRNPEPPFFSYIIGSQWPTALPEEQANLSWIKGKPAQLEACRIMLGIGSDILKISPTIKDLEKQGIEHTGGDSLADIIQNPFYKKILDLPYRVMLFWAGGSSVKMAGANKLDETEKELLYKEFFDFTTYLIKTYEGSGKTFLIGNWEGDWVAGAKQAGDDADLLPERIEMLQEWLDIRTKAIDDAKKATPPRNVAVYSFLEINHVTHASNRGLKRLVNTVLPMSSVDYVSVSSYCIQGWGPWKRPRVEENLKSLVFPAFDFIENHLPPRDISGKRVFVGEIGYNRGGLESKKNPGLDHVLREQTRLGLLSAKVNLEWGVPLWLWWATLDQAGGYQLIDLETGETTPLFNEFKTFYAWAGRFVDEHRKKTGRMPPHKVFIQKALEQLETQLAEYHVQSPP